MTALLVLTTTPDVQTAKKIARALVRQKLAACVSVREGLVSFYRWKGAVESAKESLLLIKSSKARFPKLKKALQALHPYEVPEILSIRIDGGSSKYLSWLSASLK